MSAKGSGEEGYELSLLFLVFLGINLAWEVLVGCLSHITEIWGHNTRRVLLERLKEELLDLGIISLVCPCSVWCMVCDVCVCMLTQAMISILA